MSAHTLTVKFVAQTDIDGAGQRAEICFTPLAATEDWHAKLLMKLSVGDASEETDVSWMRPLRRFLAVLPTDKYCIQFGSLRTHYTVRLLRKLVQGEACTCNEEDGEECTCKPASREDALEHLVCGILAPALEPTSRESLLMGKRATLLEENGEPKLCPVTHEPLGDDAVRFQCGHMMSGPAWKQWKDAFERNRGGMATCPSCRAQMGAVEHMWC